MCSLRACALGARKSDSVSCPSISFIILSAPFFLSYSTYSTGFRKCSRFKGRKRFSNRTPVNTVLSPKVGLSLEVQAEGPPLGGPIFTLCPKGMKVVAGALRTEDRRIIDLKGTAIFEVVIIGDDIGSLLSVARDRGDGEN